MQYLSKAYQYYSGINPATLSGAIDVIVVKRQGENGEDIYSCSPFHVRFGKLQVLRAGEKRVTLTLPDNLPADTLHQAPFWMKVGEAGEAFFVVETEAEVPEELQTSPVIMAVEDSVLTAPPLSDEDFLPKDAPSVQDSVTQQPFGQRRKSDINGEPEFLDLNSQDEKTGPTSPKGKEREETSRRTDKRRGSMPNVKNAVIKSAQEQGLSTSVSNPSLGGKPGNNTSSPSSILGTASSYLPSFLSGSATPVRPQEGTQKDLGKSSPSQKSTSKDSNALPPNPLRSRVHHAEQKYQHHAETLKDYVKEHKARASSINVGIGSSLGVLRDRKGSASSLKSLESASSRKRSDGDKFGGLQERADARLPELRDGEGEAPEVLYNEDVVLDMAGYHRQTASTKSSEDDLRSFVEETSLRSSGQYQADTAAASEQRLRDNMGLGQVLSVGSGEGLIQFAQDLLISAGALPDTNVEEGTGRSADRPVTPQSDVVREITRRLSNVELGKQDQGEDADGVGMLPEGRSGQRAGFSRGASEPPNMGHASPAADYTWEWGGFPMKTPVAEVSDPFKTRGDVLQASDLQSVPEQRPLLASTHDDALKSTSAPDIAVIGGQVSESPTRPRAAHQQSEPVLTHSMLEKNAHSLDFQHPGGRLKNDEADPYKFILEMASASHVFELGLGGEVLAGDGGVEDNMDEILSDVFEVNRITFKHFVEDPNVVDLADLVIRYDNKFLTWQNASPILAALAVYRRSLLPPDSNRDIGDDLPSLTAMGLQPDAVLTTESKGYGWSRWWRRGQSAGIPIDVTANSTPIVRPAMDSPLPIANPLENQVASSSTEERKVYFAKTLRLTSDQLGELHLKPGANRVTFSVSSSYSGVAQCSARIFLWDESDHVVISDIDGTITKSDALGHVFAAIGRDWTHLGVAKLYTDICNNGYKIMYLTSRAIGQADSTRDYLKSISQGKYQLPEGPVIMSPDRLFTSLHREVIMRKPELFKMACLRDIQRLFGGGSPAFYAGFGNRITDAMSYRSVNVPSSRIFTIDSNGEVKMELLELAGYKSSYIHMTDLVDQMFPPVHRKVIPEYTDFNFWRPAIADFAIPDLTPTPISPALSATSDSSGRLSMLGRLTGIARRGSRPALSSTSDDGKRPLSLSSRPSSPLSMPLDEGNDYEEEEDAISDRGDFMHDSRPSSMPGSFEDKNEYLADEFFDQRGFQRYKDSHHKDSSRSYGEFGPALDLGSDDGYDNEERRPYSEDDDGRDEDDDVYPEMFDDDLLATGEMSKVPY